MFGVNINSVNPILKSTFRLTFRGWAFLLLALATLVIGLIFSSTALIRTALAMLGVLSLSLPLCRWNLTRISFARILPEQVFVDTPFPCLIRLENHKNYWDSFSLSVSDEILGNGVFYSLIENSLVGGQRTGELYVDELRAGQFLTISASTVLKRRGLFDDFKICLASHFPLGLFRMECVLGCYNELAVAPAPLFPKVLRRLVRSGKGELFTDRSGVSDSYGELRGVREYNAGDPIKLIHWPLSDRHQRLVLKDFELNQPEKILLVFHNLELEDSVNPSAVERVLRILAGIGIYLSDLDYDFTFLAEFNNWKPMRVEKSEMALSQFHYSLASARIQKNDSLLELFAELDQMEPEKHQIISLSMANRNLWKNMFSHYPAVICLDQRVKLEEIKR